MVSCRAADHDRTHRLADPAGDIDEGVVAGYPSQGNVGAPPEADNRAYVEGTARENLYVQTRLGRTRYFRSGAD